MLSAIITQSFDGKELLFTDTSTAIGTVTNRSLVIKDSAGTTLTTIDMGVGTTATFDITKDRYLSFIETITLSVGSPLTQQINYRSDQFYNLAQRDLMLAGCNCCKEPLCSNQTKAREAIAASVTSFDIGDGTACQSELDAANLLISQ